VRDDGPRKGILAGVEPYSPNRRRLTKQAADIPEAHAVRAAPRLPARRYCRSLLGDPSINALVFARTNHGRTERLSHFGSPR